MTYQGVIDMRKILVCSLFAFAFLSACQNLVPFMQKPALDIGDGGILSQAPCFWGITPGLTTKVQALETFKKHFDISNCDEWPGVGSAQEIWCDPVNIQFSTSNTVDHISYSPAHPLSIDEINAKYGPPNSVTVFGWRKDGANAVTTSVTMLLYYDDIHTIAGLPLLAGTTYVVAPSTQIGGISYLANDKWEAAKTDTQSWHGYGDYEGPYWAGP